MSKMNKLPPEIQSVLCANVQMKNFLEAVQGLVYNSLDAESTSIAIRVHIEEGIIQVVDNGIGISRSDLHLLGERYVTSKYVDVKSLKSAPYKYGYQGQGIFHLIEVSKSVKITSRCENVEETCIKTFFKGTDNGISKVARRPSKGTTVEIEGFLYNRNIQKEGVSPLSELHNIELFLKQISLVHTYVSFTVRDDSRNEVIFKLPKKRDVHQTLSLLFDLNKDDFQELNVEKNNYKILSFIGKKDIKIKRWIYLNGKFLNSCKLHKVLNDNLTKLFTKNKALKKCKTKRDNEESDAIASLHNIPFYFIFITCPHQDYDIINHTATNSTLEFQDWEVINKLLEKLVSLYLGDYKLKESNFEQNQKKEKVKDTRDQVRQIMEKIMKTNPKKLEVSQMQNGIKGKSIRRKNKKKLINNSSKIVPQEDRFKAPEVIDMFAPNLENVHNEHNIMDLDLIEINCKKNKNDKHSKLTTEKYDTEIAHVTKHKQIDTEKNLIMSKFENPTDSVIQRYNKLSKEVEDLISKNERLNNEVFLTETVEFSNLTKNNKNITLRKQIEEIVIHDYGRVDKRHSDKFICEKEVGTLKSSDLVKTILNTHQKYNCDITKEDDSPKKNPAIALDCGVSNDLIALKLNYTITSSEPKVTFESHCNYKDNKDISASPTKLKKKWSHFITNESKDNFKIGENKNLNLKMSPKKNNKQAKPKIIKPKGKYKTLFDMWNIKDHGKDQTNSYTVDYSNQDKDICNKTVFNCTYTLNNESIVPEYQANNEATYSCVDGELACRIQNEYQSCSPTYEYRELSNDFTHVNNVEENKTNQPKNYVFVSESVNDKEPNNEDIEPLDLCETVLGNQSQNYEDCFDGTFHDFSSFRIFDNISRHFNELPDINVDAENAVSAGHNTNIDHEVIVLDDDIREQNFDLETVINTKNALEREINENNFDLNTRLGFVPKGMSPIFKKCKTKNACKDFHIFQDYYKDMIYNNFANDVRINIEIFAPKIQNLKDLTTRDIEKVNNKLNKDNASLIFKGHMLKHAKVLGQVDSKFIAAIIKGKCKQSEELSEYFVLFDQHAVHERIRLEKNLSDYFVINKWKSIPLEGVKLKFSKTEILYLHNYRDKFAQLGLQWCIVSNNEVLISAVPEAVLGKNPRQVEVVMGAVKHLILEEINILKSQGGCVSLYPKSIMDLVFSEACRYAVKFGDKLSKNDCIGLLDSLGDCKTPFQCAHGRPVMAVLMDVPPTNYDYKVDTTTLRKLFY